MEHGEHAKWCVPVHTGVDQHESGYKKTMTNVSKRPYFCRKISLDEDP